MIFTFFIILGFKEMFLTKSEQLLSYRWKMNNVFNELQTYEYEFLLIFFDCSNTHRLFFYQKAYSYSRNNIFGLQESLQNIEWKIYIL